MPPDAFFAGPGLDRADPLRARPEAIAELLTHPEARELGWDNGAPALGPDGRLAWAPVSGDRPLFLGFDGEAPRFSRLPDGDIPINARAHWALLSQLDERDAPLFAAALSLANWHRRHGHCSVCGHSTEPNRGGWSRACPGCGAEHYPRCDPVVIMLAEDGDRLLLGRQPAYPPGRYSALAGFVEPGETIEAAVIREIGEEAGIRVADVRYVASQPWPFPTTLMIGCTARAVETDIRIDRTELDDARWFSRDEVRSAMKGDPGAPFEPPNHYAIAWTLLNHWLDA